MNDLSPIILPITNAKAVRSRLVDVLRRDQSGPNPADVDLERERLRENPSRWYLNGFLAPLETRAADEAPPEEEGDPLFGDDEAADPESGRARAADDAPADEPAARSRRLPTSLGLTVLVDAAAATAARLVDAARRACGRIADGIALLGADDHARLAFRAMNEAVARAARQRNAGPRGDPEAQARPYWRPFQLAFVLLNLNGLQDRIHPDREVVDLLFFPTGGGKTEAYLGLAAWTIAYRRITSSGLAGAGVSVLMRYTLRLLTLDQLSRAAGVVCALELMRGEPAWQDDDKRLLGDWPIEIGLWVGSAASPNRLGKTGDGRQDTAVAGVRRYQKDGKEAPAPIRVCPWCGRPFVPLPSPACQTRKRLAIWRSAVPASRALSPATVHCRC